MFRDKDGYVWQKECTCGALNQIRMNSRLRFANLPPKYKDVELKKISMSVYKNPQEKQKFKYACDAIIDYLNRFEKMQNDGLGLYLYSKTKGSGKTYVMAGIANTLMKNKNVPVKFATSMQIIDEIKATWDRENAEYSSEHKLLDDLVTTKILIIDDFGTEKARDWVSDKFYSIINGRYIDNKITMFTSNMTLDDLAYDDRITNRIKERVYMIPFPEESVRDSIAAENNDELFNILKGDTNETT